MLDQYNRILVAIDGSANSIAAFNHAVSIAKRNQASLYIASIINERVFNHDAHSTTIALEDERRKITSLLNRKREFAEEYGVKSVIPIMAFGNPKKQLATLIPIKEQNDLIVIGATGKGRLERATLGTTTDYVVQKATCHVLVIKEAQ